MGRLALRHSRVKIVSHFLKPQVSLIGSSPLGATPHPVLSSMRDGVYHLVSLQPPAVPSGQVKLDLGSPNKAQQSTHLGFHAPVGTWNLNTHEVSMEIFLWFIAMICGSYQYEPAFLLLLSFVCLTIIFVLANLWFRRTKPSKAIPEKKVR